MTSPYYYLLCLFLFTCQGKNEHLPQVAKAASPPIHAISKIVVKSVHFDITTFVNIDCDVFDRQFPNAAVTQLTDKSIFIELTRHIRLFKPTIKKYPLDTRAKIYIYYNDNTSQTICMSKFRMVYNGKPIQYDKSLSSLLQISTD